MNKERIKLFILILLIVNSIQLTVQLWFDSNLWPEGFGEFARNVPILGEVVSFFGNKNGEYTGEKFYAKTVKPRRIVVNGGGAREVYLKESDFYNAGIGYVEDLLAKISEQNVYLTEVSYDEWKNYFKAKSVYVDYGYCMNGNEFGRLLGLEGSTNVFSQSLDFSGFIITPNITTGTFTICTYNEGTNKVSQYEFIGDVDNLFDFIEETTRQKQQNHAFAFEINLDVMSASGEEIERKVAFSPLSLLEISTDVRNEPVLSADKVFADSQDFEQFTEKVLNVFGYTASSLRKTVQSDGTITFVENNATIKFFNDGTIEYNAVSKENGLSLSKGISNSYQAVCDVLNGAGKIWNISRADNSNFDYHLVSDLKDNKENVYEVKIDSMYKGTAIHYSNVCENAVYGQVEEGYITKLVVHLSDISQTEKTSAVAPVLMSIDTIYEKYQNDGMVIEDVYRCYDFDHSGVGISKWIFKLNGKEESLVVDTEM